MVGQVELLEEDNRGLKTRYGRIWIPKSSEVKEKLLESSHRSKYSIHTGATKMYQDLKRDYWWPGMKRDIVNLEMGTWKWENITMNLITKLPRTPRQNDAMTKSALFLQIKETSSSEVLAEIYMKEVVVRHGVPVLIVSD
ncbi:uncharacterized protein [Rutidosis leptorrhynchoides]|uniref:uncharacterized protein n=1 Tax=Rutidosis leptorrhynchoides TaxID=125765 RepID=UPI003A9A2CDD